MFRGHGWEKAAKKHTRKFAQIAEIVKRRVKNKQKVVDAFCRLDAAFIVGGQEKFFCVRAMTLS